MRAISEHQQSLYELLKVDQPDTAGQEKAVQHLEQLKKACLECSQCDLRGGCRQVVYGDGNHNARLMLVGEGPGADEDRLGIPFVGKAGQLLNRILEAADISRLEIYIANVVKCRPPGNRLPLQAEVDACLPHLKDQIAIINPEIIVCLGSLAARTLINKNLFITRSRGQWHENEGRRFIATFHPAALLRDPGKKKDVWEDFKKVMHFYHKD